MLFLFFTELALILLITYIAFKFHIDNLDMVANYEATGYWIYYIPSLMPPSMFDWRVILGIKIGVLAVCALFVLPLLLLLFVQVRNFCAAKTTNERFSRRKPATDSGATMADSNSSDSMKGNLLDGDEDPESHRHKKQYSDSQGNCFSNCYEMCCSRKIDSQDDIFREHATKP